MSLMADEQKMRPATGWLHFAWVEDHEKCIVVTRICVSVCLSAAACRHYCTDPDVTWGSGRGCPLFVHYWSNLQSVHGMRAMATLWKCMAEPSGNPPGPGHAAHTTHACTSDKIDAPAACATLSATRLFHFVHTAQVLQREREMLASTCLYSLYA